MDYFVNLGIVKIFEAGIIGILIAAIVIYISLQFRPSVESIEGRKRVLKSLAIGFLSWVFVLLVGVLLDILFVSSDWSIGYYVFFAFIGIIYGVVSMVRAYIRFGVISKINSFAGIDIEKFD